MRRQSWEDMQDILKIMAKTVPGTSLSGIYNLAPALWIEFLNTDPRKGKSMWPIYREFARYVRDFKVWMAKAGCSFSSETENQLRLLSREEFSKRYPTELQTDAEKLHRGMQEVIDRKFDVIMPLLSHAGISASPDYAELYSKGAHEYYISTLTKGADIPPPGYNCRSTFPNDPATSPPNSMSLHIPSAGHPNFWLSVMIGGMLSSYISPYSNGQMVRRGAAPDCEKYFIPYPRGQAQKYHSPTCRSRVNSRRRRSSL